MLGSGATVVEHGVEVQYRLHAIEQRGSSLEVFGSKGCTINHGKFKVEL